MDFWNFGAVSAGISGINGTLSVLVRMYETGRLVFSNTSRAFYFAISLA